MLGLGAMKLSRRRAAGETLTEIARTFNVSHTTIARLLAQPSNEMAHQAIDAGATIEQ